MSANFTHGYSGYHNYRCRCDICRAGNVDYQRQARQRRRARIVADPSLAPHGSVNTYFNWRCPCDECKAAHAMRTRELARQRRAKS